MHMHFNYLVPLICILNLLAYILNIYGSLHILAIKVQETQKVTVQL